MHAESSSIPYVFYSHVIVDPLGYMENMSNVMVETLPSVEIFMCTVGSIKKQANPNMMAVH